jgi:hypothetical protein
VDMSNVTINVGSGGTGISGTFNGFAFQQMTLVGDGIYSYTVSLLEGSSIEYKFRNGTQVYENPPLPCGSGGFGNRVIIVPDVDTVLDVVCFSSCTPCNPLGEFYNLTFIVDASEIDILNPEGIYIAGTFNAFNPAPMANAGSGLYTFTASVEEGSTVLWKYLNGSSFDDVEIVPEACGQDDGFEGFNRIFTMPSQPTVLNAVCFSSCEPCESQPNPFTLVFQVDASNLPTVHPNGIHIAGTFNGFTPVPMVNAGAGIFTFTTSAQVFDIVLWKYINGPSFDDVEVVPQECGTPDGFGGFNRTFEMPDQNVVLDVVCFSSCAACLPDGVNNISGRHTALFAYPNPVTGAFNLLAPESGMLQLRIIDLTGKTVHNEMLAARAGEAIQDITAPKVSGIYLVELRTAEGNRYQAKLIVQ